MAYSVIWTARAIAELEVIVDYLNECRETSGTSLFERIQSRVASLGEMPRTGGLYGDRTPEVRQVIVGNYRIFYSIDDTVIQVRILTVWHSSRQEPDLE